MVRVQRLVQYDKRLFSYYWLQGIFIDIYVHVVSSACNLSHNFEFHAHI